MLSEGIAQRGGKGGARQNSSPVSVGLVSPPTQGAGKGRDRTLPVPALQGAPDSAVLASGKFESALTDCGRGPFPNECSSGDETTGFPISLSGTTCSTALYSSHRSWASSSRRDRMQLRELKRQRPAARAAPQVHSGLKDTKAPQRGRKQEERGSGILGCG